MALIDLYWSIGEHISLKTAEEGWGQGTVEALAKMIHRRYPTSTRGVNSLASLHG